MNKMKHPVLDIVQVQIENMVTLYSSFRGNNARSTGRYGSDEVTENLFSN